MKIAMIIKSLLHSFKTSNSAEVFTAVIFLCYPLFVNTLYLGKAKFVVSLLQAMALVFPLFIFPRLKKIYLWLLLIFVYGSVLLNIGHIIIYDVALSSSSYQSLFDTNFREAGEYVMNFLNRKFVIILLVMLLPALIYVIRTSRVFAAGCRSWSAKICFAAIIICWCKGVFNFAVYDERYKLQLLKMYDEYHNFKSDMEKLKELREKRGYDKFTNINKIWADDKKQTYVVVIGESADRHHMQVYGYERETTPYMEKLRPQLYFFDEVLSPNTFTIESLKKVLSWADDENPDAVYNKGSLINYLQDSGFKVFWISNQYTIGDYDNLIAVLAADADHKEFVNHHHWKAQESGYDEKVLVPFAKALEDESSKKVIFVHLMGSHGMYKNRYPEEFAKFSGDNERRQKLAEYDNSFLYTDYVWHKMWQKMQNENDEIAAMVYFSDHGEDVRDVPESCHCRVEDKSKITEYMTAVPFVLWVSDAYKKERGSWVQNLSKRRHKPYNTQDFEHSFADLCGLSSADTDKKKSIFSR